MAWGKWTIHPTKMDIWWLLGTRVTSTFGRSMVELMLFQILLVIAARVNGNQAITSSFTHQATSWKPVAFLKINLFAWVWIQVFILGFWIISLRKLCKISNPLSILLTKSQILQFWVINTVLLSFLKELPFSKLITYGLKMTNNLKIN